MRILKRKQSERRLKAEGSFGVLDGGYEFMYWGGNQLGTGCGIRRNERHRGGNCTKWL